MSGKKRRGGGSDKIAPWLTARSDGRREPFMMLSGSLLTSERFASLTLTAQRTYLCMAAHSSGRREFEFAQGLAEKTYHIPRNSFRAGIKQLVAAGFIERVEDGSFSQYAPARYRFIFDWKQSPRP